MGEHPKSRVSRPLAWAILFLLALSIPWYHPAGSGAPFVWGIPLWGVVSFACYAAIAAIVAAAIPRLWDEGPADRF